MKQIVRDLSYRRREALLLILIFLVILSPIAGPPYVQRAVAVESVLNTINVGTSPERVDVNPTTNRVYVANSRSNTTSVIDASTSQLIATIPVGRQPRGIAVNPANNRVYVANSDSRTVTVIDGLTNQVLTTIVVPFKPEGVVANPRTNRVYAAAGGFVYAIDGSTNQIVATIPIGSAAWGLALNSNTNRLYAANWFSNTVSVIDVSDNVVVTTVNVGLMPRAVAVNPNTNRVYVVNENSSTTSVIDASTNRLVATIQVEGSPWGAAVDPNTNRLYVANRLIGTVSVIDGSTNQKVATVVVGSRPIAVAVNPSTGRVYVANYASNTVSVLGEPPFDFTLSTPSTMTLDPAKPATATISVNLVTGAPQRVSLSVSGLPTGVSASFSPSSGSPSFTSSLTITTGSGITPRTYNFNIAASGGGKTKSASVVLIVQPGFEFAVSISPIAMKLEAGQSTSSTVTVTLSTGSPQPVSLSVSGLPSGATGTFSPSSGNPTFTSTLSIATSGATPYGTYTMTISASGGGKVRSATANLLIRPSLSAVPSSEYVMDMISVGTGPFGVAINPSTNRVYVNNLIQNTTSVIDGSTSQVIATIAVGTGPGWIGVNQNTNRVYVANAGSNSVSVIDGSVNQVIATIAVGREPLGVAVNAATNRVYVSHGGFNTSSVSVIDGSTNRVVATIPVGSSPIGLAVNPTTNRVYVANFLSNTISVIDGSTNRVVATIPVDEPLGVAVNSNTNRVYVSSELANTTLVIDGSTNTVVATIRVGGGPSGLAVNPTSGRLFVANLVSSTVSVIDLSRNAVIATIPVGSSPFGVAVNPTTSRVYVSSFGAGIVSVLEPPFDFTIGTPDAIRMEARQISSINLRITLTSGSTRSVSLSVSGLPSGVTGTFSPSSGNPPFTSTLAIETAPTVAPGTHQLTITATGGGKAKSVSTQLTVIQPPFDFRVEVATGSVSIEAGQIRSLPILVNRVSGSSQPVSLSVTGLPTGAMGSFSPNSINPTFTSTLTIATSSATPAGTFSITITGVSGSLTKTATVALIVTAPPPPPFAFRQDSPTAGPVRQGDPFLFRLTLSVVRGVSEVLTLSAEGLPRDARASFNPDRAATPFTSLLTILTSSTTPLGKHAVTVIAAPAEGERRSVLIELEIIAAREAPIRALSAGALTLKGSGNLWTFIANVTGGQPPYTYLWSFGDGGNSREQSPTYRYSSPGDYTVTLTVADSKGSTTSSKPATATAKSEVVDADRLQPAPRPSQSGARVFFESLLPLSAGATSVVVVVAAVIYLRSRRTQKLQQPIPVMPQQPTSQPQQVTPQEYYQPAPPPPQQPITAPPQPHMTPPPQKVITSPPEQFTPTPLVPSLQEQLFREYAQVQPLGEGGFARVYRAVKRSGETVALKIPMGLDKRIGRAFLHEISAWRELSHPSIIRIYDFNIVPLPYIEMEFGDGGSLADYPRPVAFEQACALMLRVAEGIEYAHAKGRSHRDLKPQNILMTRKGEPKITDWGLSRIASATTTASVRGYTPLYAAPEQIEPKLGRADEKTDVYQFGVIFYELLTDELPFRGEGLAELHAKILNEPPPLPSEINQEAKPADSLIQACLQKAKDARPIIVEVKKRLTKILEAKYNQSLTDSKSLGNTKRALYYCSELAMAAAKNGDARACSKYLADFQMYVSEDLKGECARVLEEVQNCVKFGLSITEGLVSRIDNLIHRARLE